MLYKKLTHKYTLLRSRNGRLNTPVSLCVKRPKPLPTVLTIFNAQAKNYFGLHLLKVAFYYLTFNRSKEVVVVCSYAEKQNGWHDWFYSWI
jgi:hypothetical protein